MTQAALANLAGISAEQISQLERGKSQPTLGTMLALQRALDLHTLEELISVLPTPGLMPSAALWRDVAQLSEKNSSVSSGPSPPRN